MLRLALASFAMSGSTVTTAAQGLPQVRVETEAGSLTLEIDSVRAPLTARNFLRYVDAGLFAGGVFHRTVKLDNQPNNAVKIQVIQAGMDTTRRGEKFEPIPLERTGTTGLTHRDGVVSMARGGPDSATDGFFICIGDQPELDLGGKRNADGQGFAAFGRVLQGMDVVRAIQVAPADGQRLTPPVRILRVSRLP
jgi:peptidyl-prolyl cis-trans isomerase A (cyclophilin A)